MRYITKFDLTHPDQARDKGVIYVIDGSWWATPIVLPILKMWVLLTKKGNKNKRIWSSK